LGRVLGDLGMQGVWGVAGPVNPQVHKSMARERGELVERGQQQVSRFLAPGFVLKA